MGWNDCRHPGPWRDHAGRVRQPATHSHYAQHAVRTGRSTCQFESWEEGSCHQDIRISGKQKVPMRVYYGWKTGALYMVEEIWMKPNSREWQTVFPIFMDFLALTPLNLRNIKWINDRGHCRLYCDCKWSYPDLARSSPTCWSHNGQSEISFKGKACCPDHIKFRRHKTQRWNFLLLPFTEIPMCE